MLVVYIKGTNASAIEIVGNKNKFLIATESNIPITKSTTDKKHIKCGLIGEKLGHSFSPQIHKELADYSYTLFEMPEHEVGDFLNSNVFDSTNVTIPYKKTVMPYLDVISDEALRIGSVNTITRLPDGGLKGDNTDYYGF